MSGKVGTRGQELQRGSKRIKGKCKRVEEGDEVKSGSRKDKTVVEM